MLARARLPCKKTVPENALLRQVGGRPLVAPTYSIGCECDFLTRRSVSRNCQASCCGRIKRRTANTPGQDLRLPGTAYEGASLHYRTPGKRAHLAPGQEPLGLEGSTRRWHPRPRPAGDRGRAGRRCSGVRGPRRGRGPTIRRR